MKSPLKEKHDLSRLLQHHHIGSYPCPVQQLIENEEIDDSLEVLFGEDFVKPVSRGILVIVAEAKAKFSGINIVDKANLKNANNIDQDDCVSTKLQEWNVVSSFDLINDASVSSSAPLLLTPGPSTSAPTKLARRVQFATDENGNISCIKYDPMRSSVPAIVNINAPQIALPTGEDYSVDLRSLWYNAADFRQFRTWFHETANSAVQDESYRQYFMTLYHAACCSPADHTLENSATLAFIKEHAVSFAKYRGLERAIFRNELQTDKIASIKGVVWCQEEETNDSNEHSSRVPGIKTVSNQLAATSAPLTETARMLAGMYGAADAAVVEHYDKLSKRRFVEI